MAFVLGKDRAYVLAHPERELHAEEQRQWDTSIERRRAGEPVAYIIEQREFYRRMFLVDQRVHIPRPSTENLVAMALDFLMNPHDEHRDLETGIVGVAKVLRDCSAVQTIVDVGTGSGCIAITLALERPDLQIIAIDISADALMVAKENAARLGASRIDFLEGDLLLPIKNYREPFIIVSNPPYLSDGDISANPDLRHEPSLALFGGANRNTLIQRMERDASAMENCTGTIMEHMC
ncbi:MAG: hypothetical protein Greene041662_193 [Candidatus Peregrinibacteria bacterium Greene0416_62]|nr:MAG: hypothetical protein Greene041662_193 [Candidatus Peregrinibacteria bacterium Greene0416_62]TSC99582.1 MAG: hypothetical protein Greene101449_579 [Candidatus Peregrinibacteria bacterium Greene1014_49]